MGGDPESKGRTSYLATPEIADEIRATLTGSAGTELDGGAKAAFMRGALRRMKQAAADDEAEQAEASKKRGEQERLAWEAYEAAIEEERKAEAEVRAAWDALESIQHKRAAARALLDQAMEARNRLDMGDGSS